MHLAEVLARDWGYLVQQRKQPIKKCLFCVQWDTAEVVTVSFLWETWSSGHLHALTWPSVLTNRLTTASSDLYSLVAVMSDNVGSDDRGYGDLGKKQFKPNRQLPLNDQCQRVLFLFSFFLFIGQCNVWKYVTVLHIFSCITSEFPWCGQPKPNCALRSVVQVLFAPNDPTNVSAPYVVVWQTTAGYSFYSVFFFAEWEAYAVTHWPVWVSVIM